MKESAVLTLTDCEAKDEAFTAAQKTSFGFDDTGNWSYFVGDTEAQTEQNKTNAMNGAEYYKLEDSTSKLISAKVLASTTVAITIDGTKQVGGTDYNRYTKLASQTPGETTGGAADAE